MAGIPNNNNDNPFDHSLYLSPTQQDLLLAALTSNNGRNQASHNPAAAAMQQQYGLDMTGNFGGVAQHFPPMDLNSLNYEESPFDNALDADGNFDYGSFDAGGQMIGPLPGEELDDEDDEDDGEIHDKRKSPGDGSTPDADESNKRHEPEEKTAKKPGRKPLTTEPTTKRKAQNRAAQRAFRERKEKHLKDLETKVGELEKQSEAANHENGLLRAQVSRLQTELREYRKRLSLNRSGVSGSPPSASNGFSSYLGGLTNNAGGNNFQFEFPRFGGLPGAHIFNNGSLARSNSGASNHKLTDSTASPAVLSRSDTNGRVSPGSQHARSNSTAASTPQNANGASPSPFGTLNTANVEELNGANGTQHRTSTDSTGGRSRVFQFNSSGGSNNGSPSASSVSYNGVNSSCGTSPEPNHNSPKDMVTENGYMCTGDSEGEISFCVKLNMACGNPRNPVPRAKSFGQQSNGEAATKPAGAAAADAKPSTATTSATNHANAAANNNFDFGFDLLANQNGGQFDPTLFGDYRESQAAIVGDGNDFSSGFFNEAFPFPDMNSPFNFGGTGLTPAPEAHKTNPMELADKLTNGDDEEVVPGEAPGLSCHQIWDKLQKHPKFGDGGFDIDNLCTELRAKAKCSESGVVVDQKDVDAALRRITP